MSHRTRAGEAAQGRAVTCSFLPHGLDHISAASRVCTISSSLPYIYEQITNLTNSHLVDVGTNISFKYTYVYVQLQVKRECRSIKSMFFVCVISTCRRICTCACKYACPEVMYDGKSNEYTLISTYITKWLGCIALYKHSIFCCNGVLSYFQSNILTYIRMFSFFSDEEKWLASRYFLKYCYNLIMLFILFSIVKTIYRCIFMNVCTCCVVINGNGVLFLSMFCCAILCTFILFALKK